MEVQGRLTKHSGSVMTDPGTREASGYKRVCWPIVLQTMETFEAKQRLMSRT